MNVKHPLRTHFERFVTVSDAEFERIQQRFKVKHLEKNSNAMLPGDSVNETFWVEEGLLISIYNDETGKEHILQFAIENCWITDQEAFYNQTTGSLTIKCLENATVWALSFDDRETLCDELPAMQKFFRKKANDSFVKQQRRLLTYLTSDAQQRLRLLMQEYPGLIQRVPKTILAAYLGVSRETLSRFKL
ncbi:MAG TPA: Crp/Fnr family transcriptional regulator [Chryseosolibacter sp.]